LLVAWESEGSPSLVVVIEIVLDDRTSPAHPQLDGTPYGHSVDFNFVAFDTSSVCHDCQLKLETCFIILDVVCMKMKSTSVIARELIDR
jgi:hypothetical protein